MASQLGLQLGTCSTLSISGMHPRDKTKSLSFTQHPKLSLPSCKMHDPTGFFQFRKVVSWPASNHHQMQELTPLSYQPLSMKRLAFCEQLVLKTIIPTKCMSILIPLFTPTGVHALIFSCPKLRECSSSNPPTIFPLTHLKEKKNLYFRYSQALPYNRH